MHTWAVAVDTVVGRESELQAVEAFLDRANPERTALAIVGEPGIGKTTVWTRALERAHERGATVLTARPAESEAGLSFAGLADLLSTVAAPVLASIPAPQRTALEVALLQAPATHAPERRLVASALLSVLRALADDAEVVLAIDDLHWLDGPSASAVEFALRRVGNEPLRAIFSVRTGAAESPPLAALARERRVAWLELGPLSVAALHRVLLHELGRSFPRPRLVRIATASGGNPLYAVEIARLVDRGADAAGAGDLPVPDSLSSLVAARVRALPARTRDALLRAAALAKPSLRLVDADALAAGEEAGLVRIGADGRIEFAHPLFASAVYTSASVSRRRKTHRALAEAVDDPEERARHVALSSESPDEGAALEVEAAARRARMRGAPDTAAELTELAIRLLPERSRTGDELRLRLAEHLYLASDFPHAVTVLEELRKRLDRGDLRARVLLLLADIDYWRTGESAALALAEEALADAQDELVRARCHVAIAMNAGTVELPKAADAARAAVALLEPRADLDPGLLAAALGARVRSELFLGHGLDVATAERALALEEASPPAAVDTRVVFKLGQWLRYVDDFDGARARLAQAAGQAYDEGDESSLGNILLNRVVLETWAGELDEATALAEQMIDAFAQHGVRAAGANVWQAYVDAFAGRTEAVRAAAATTDPQEPIVAAIWKRSLGLAELAAGETEAADRHLSAAVVEFERVHFREPAIWRVDGDAIEAALGAGDVERATRMLAQFEAQAARSGIPWSLAVSARCRGHVHAVDGDLELAAATFLRALDEHARCPMPFERARTLLAHGQVLRRLKRKRQARDALEQAAEIFARIGADPWVDRTGAELRRVAVRRAPQGLSPTELRIAGLAADGLTNRAIAEQAFVSVNTVEANLKRAYAKLGIRSRAQLARALDDLRATPIP